MKFIIITIFDKSDKGALFTNLLIYNQGRTKSQQSRPQNNLVKGEIWPKFYTHNINILLKYSVALHNFFSALHEVISMQETCQ